ncbi:LSM domain protein [Staphylococcus sp. SQ8-PEA]|uniref:LSM domain protein n=1 Tax=Staphylococcus marylandisciuri TaxID=2981529 RepID=A0ABT2QRS5_9STAP|nr:LSM domain protein [Staphylococcus marylandisciuri]MCU5746660.1 LSM domain protein [Staphylococcus marylandisciuri]
MSFKLWEFEGKEVEMRLDDGDVLKGTAFDFDDKEDNVSGNDSISIKSTEGTFDIDESRIVSIKEIK